MSDIPHQVSDFISKSAPFDVLDEDKVSAIATKSKIITVTQKEFSPVFIINRKLTSLDQKQ